MSGYRTATQQKGLRRVVPVLSAVLLLSAPPNASAAQGTPGATPLASHKALYRTSLARASEASSVAAARGAMLYTFQETCDAWTSETNIHLRLAYEDGPEVVTAWTFASWEAKDGLSYRFRVRHKRDGHMVEELKGEVHRDTPDAAVDVAFREPADKRLRLPEGAMFPTRHLRQVLSAAAKDKGRGGRISRLVFDGASLDNPYEINAVIAPGPGIGKPRTGAKSSPAELNAMITAAGMGDLPSRHVRLAFFPVASRAAIPEFELGVDYRADGVATHILQDFGSFSINLTPQSLEMLAGPTC